MITILLIATLAGGNKTELLHYTNTELNYIEFNNNTGYVSSDFDQLQEQGYILLIDDVAQLKINDSGIQAIKDK